MKQNGMDEIAAEWLGVRQVTQYANISERTIRGWIHSPVDSLPAVRIVGKILIRRSELDAWLARHRLKPIATVDLDGIVKDVLQKVAHGR
jgi:excisionase family DNA binding protein